MKNCATGEKDPVFGGFVFSVLKPDDSRPWLTGACLVKQRPDRICEFARVSLIAKKMG
jgi:hypothetical protein